MSRRWLAWARRGALVVILVGVVLVPRHTASIASRSCRSGECPADGAVRWSRELTGSWIAENGPQGTVPGQGQAYAAIGGDVAVVGFGLSVDAYDAGNGFPRWAAVLTGLPAGSSIVSVRAWPGVVTVGAALPPGGTASVGGGSAGVRSARSGSVRSGSVRSGSAGSGSASSRLAGSGSAPREEVVLNAVTGKWIRTYPAAAYGGTVSASIQRTVVVGPASVTSYNNATGAPKWRDPIGAAQQAWHIDGGSLFVTISARGVIGTAPVTAVRQISLRTGAERLIRPKHGPFAGTFSGAADGDLLFAGVDGLTAYSTASGRSWRRPGAVFEGTDPVQQVLYVDIAGALLGIDPVTGQNERGTAVPGPPGTYSVWAGVALGLDSGTRGAAWGYSIVRQHVIWTTRSLPWPHYFVDLSGLGGSADQANGTVLLATCARTGAVTPLTTAGPSGLACLRPMLVAIER
ncbi:MAG TPA: hypothetical protein VN840_14565 [Streptosporangiaceae bacterium]|nr:hypothetical protein [Streptosporangiaceae bacterium]